MAPCVVMIDEVEKALSGVQASGQTDSGVSARLFASLLTWMNDHESEAFVVCTANDVSKLPPEFSRAERMDACFFLDLPAAREKDLIWRLYLDRFGLTSDDSVDTQLELYSLTDLNRATLVDRFASSGATAQFTSSPALLDSLGRIRVNPLLPRLVLAHYYPWYTSESWRDPQLAD